MSRLAFLADEHVPRVFLTTLRSSGYAVELAQDRYGQHSVDETIVEDCRDDGLVALTNDRDFVRLGTRRDHAGIVMYTDRNRLLDAPLEAVKAIDRTNRYYSPDTIANNIEWLENWL
jgi:hypothetical protein